ncbi:MAG: hypothetical protein OEY89_12245 [Gammaproteobacteria bacterium]|nr:hypothetical protein [Gammaproteobacteria bacterium]
MESNPTKERLLELHKQYQKSVKAGYQIHFNTFENWVSEKGNFEEGYIEIPGNETLSGHAVILDW